MKIELIIKIGVRFIKKLTGGGILCCIFILDQCIL